MDLSIGGCIKYMETNGDCIVLKDLMIGRNRTAGLKNGFINGVELSLRKIESSSMYLTKMKESLESTKQVLIISNNKKLKTKDKIKMIQELLPEESVTFIANVLNISRQAIHRHL